MLEIKKKKGKKAYTLVRTYRKPESFPRTNAINTWGKIRNCEQNALVPTERLAKRLASTSFPECWGELELE